MGLKSYVEKTFTDGDYYRATDARMRGKRYKRLGVYDFSTSNKSNGFRPKDDPDSAHPIKYDESYWQAMVQSKFVVCPGGDKPWSYRFYETFGTRAIPVINSYQTDWQKRGTTVAINNIGFEHKMTNDHMYYDPDMANRNYAKY